MHGNKRSHGFGFNQRKDGAVMAVKTTRLTERESRILHAVERSLAYWEKEVTDRNFAGRNEAERDMAMSIERDLIEIRDMFTEDYSEDTLQTDDSGCEPDAKYSAGWNS